MPCDDPICRLNDELLSLLPALDFEQQQRVLKRWRELDPGARDGLVRSLREPVAGEADLMTLSKLADYFQCGVYDVLGYTRAEAD